MRKLLFVVFIISPLFIFAKGIEEKTHHRVGFNGAVTSSDSWQLEFSYHYMFNRHIGLGGSVGSWEVWYEDGWASGKSWNIGEDDNKPWNL